MFVLDRTGGQICLSGYNRAAAELLENISPDHLNCPVDQVFAEYPELSAWLTSCYSSETIHYQEDHDRTHPGLKFSATRLDADQRLIHIENIYKQRLAEKESRMTQERLELAIYATDSGLWDWHIPSGEVIFGEQWAAILGYTLDEIKPHLSTWENLVHPDDRARVMLILEQYLAGKLPRYECEHRLRAKDGSWVWVLDAGKVVEWDKHHKPLRMTGTKVDISRRKKAEEELAQLNQDLEKRIEKRTRKLKESQQSLLESQNHLLELNSALKILLKKSGENKREIEENMLANVLEMVIPYLMKIEEEALTDTQKIYLNVIRTNLDEITSPFSRQLTTKHFNLTPAEISVAKLIKQGKATKEIAELLNLSSKTIETQRRSIRRKLGLNGKKMNLKTFLDESLDQV